MKIATNLVDNSDFELDLSVLLRTHTFIQGMTGSAKTDLILNLVEQVKKERPEVQMVFLDDQEEYTELPQYFKEFKLISRDATPKIFSLDHAFQIGKQSRKQTTSIVVNLHDFDEQPDRETFVAEFLKGFSSLGKEVGTPAIVFVDEADQYCPSKNNRANIPSRYPIVNMTKRARKQNISMVLATQYLSEVDIRARRECANRIVGKTTELRDRRTVKELMGLSDDQAEELFDFTAGNFFVRGEIFVKGVSRIYVTESKILRKQAGVADEQFIITHKQTNSDIFEESVVNKSDQNLVELLQSKIGDLEKQLADQKLRTKEAYDEGYDECEIQWKEKPFMKRVLLK